MAYVFQDNVYLELKQAIDALLEGDAPIGTLERKIVGLLLTHLAGQGVHMIDSMLDKELAEPLVKDIQLLLSTAPKIFESLLKSMTNELGGILMSRVNGVPWFFPDELAPEVCGMIPSFLNIEDERGIVEQFDAHYQHGGGWRRQAGFKLNKKTWHLKYAEDPPLTPLGGAALNGEVVVIYQLAWVMVVSSENKFQVARMD